MKSSTLTTGCELDHIKGFVDYFKTHCIIIKKINIINRS